MAHFFKSGNIFKVAAEQAAEIYKLLPAGNYTIKEDPFGTLYLEQIEAFSPIKKMYGDTVKNTQRIINTFMDRPASTGVMLAGEKGSGKSLLTKNIAIELAKRDIPTIVINAPWHGDKFNMFIQSITQPCAILLDEFEKTYDKEEQQSLLTLLDGVFPSKKLFLLTCNDKWRVDEHMRNRPGRIFYMLDFKGLTEEFIAEYCEDTLEDKKHIDTICNIATLFAEFNFDMLKAMVEEMNRYGESPQEALRMLNAKPEFDGGSEYEVEFSYEGTVLPNDRISCDETFVGNPLQPKGLHFAYLDKDPRKNKNADWVDIKFDSASLVSVDSKKGKFIFEDRGCKLVLTRVKQKTYNYYQAF